MTLCSPRIEMSRPQTDIFILLTLLVNFSVAVTKYQDPKQLAYRRKNLIGLMVPE